MNACVCGGELSEHELVEHPSMGDERVIWVCHHDAGCLCGGYYPEWAQVAVIHAYGLETDCVECSYCGQRSGAEEGWQGVVHNAGCEVVVGANESWEAYQQIRNSWQGYLEDQRPHADVLAMFDRAIEDSHA